MPTRAIVFDLFDTLVDLPMDALPRLAIGGRLVPSTAGALHREVAARKPIELDAFVAMLAEVDRTHRETHYAAGRELPTLDRFTALVARLGLADPELAQRLTDVHMGMVASVARAHAHHPALLARLRRRARLGVCSNFSHTPTALAVLSTAGLGEALDAVVVSHDAGWRKPRREIFEAVLEALAVAPAEAVHVGDSLAADIAGAAALGMRTAWITRCVRDVEAALARHSGPAPTWVIRDLAELEPLLDAEP
jgi:HAD superfamily hydrolase (TIGR01549 family)